MPWYIGWPVVLASIYFGLRYFAARAVFYPMRYPQGLWDLQSEVGASDVWLDTTDHIRLNAWWVPRPGARLVTLFLHGNAGNVTHRFHRLREIPSAGSSILLADYRGYGRSAGRPSERGIYIDAQTAYDYLLRDGYTPGQIIIHGESLGTAAAVHLAAQRPCAALILEAPFPSAKEVARTVIPFLGPLLISGFDSRSIIAQVNAPVLFIQGDQDEIIPLRLGRVLFDAAPQPKSFWVVPGAHHNDIAETAGDAYRERLQSFYATLAEDKTSRE